MRVSYCNNGSGAEIVEENNFYPFGLKHEGYNTTSGDATYNYEYNGKELQTETGWSDYGWRQYMPEIGKWNGMDQLSENYSSTSPFAYVANNPISNFDVDERLLAQSLINQINGASNGTVFTNNGSGFDDNWGGSMDYFGNSVIHNSHFTTSLGQKPGDGGGGGAGGALSNIIINFIRGDKEHLGNFVNSDFEKNGWHVIDATSLEDALAKLTKYLRDSQADNIYINSHGLVSERYVFDENGQTIPDSKSETGYKMTRDTGFYTSKDKILGSHLQQYALDKSKLSPDKQASIDSLVGIANYVKSGKNLIMGTCWSVRYDDLFGTSISSIVTSRDIFANRDYSSLWPLEGKIRFQDFTGFNQTPQKNYIDGWVQYRNGAAVQRNFNIIMTKYGVKTIK